MINLYHSRRGTFKKCYFWTPNEQITNLSNYVLNNTPTGSFSAKEVSDITKDGGQIGGVIYKNDNQSVTLSTPDNVTKMVIGSIVKYDKKEWIVKSIAYKLESKETEFGDGIAETYISLRR